MTELAFCTATELGALVRARTVGCRELLEHYLHRIERFDPVINAVVVRRFELARKRADEADAALAQGKIWGPLHGVPMTVKESFDVAGQPTTWGVPKLSGTAAATNAVLVDRLEQAGAIIFGKTNLPYMLLDLQAYNDIYGQTNNPWDLERTSGGSSGGAAAAVSSGLTGLDIGSDIGGSIRLPAHFCGVYAHKPTWGIIPDRGHALGGLIAPTDIMTAGPLARGAEDLALTLDSIAGADSIDGGWQLKLPKPVKKRLAEFKVAAWLEDENCPVDAAVSERLNALVENLRKAGAEVDLKARPDFSARHSLETYMILMMGVTTAGLPDKEVARAQAKLAELAPDDDSMGAWVTRCSVMSHRHWVAANEARARLRWAWKAFFEDYDVVLMPPTPAAAFLHDHSPAATRTIQVNGQPLAYWHGIFWAQFAGVGQLPATIAPIGRTAQGLPVGVQILGPAYGDLSTIEFARLVGQEFGGFAVPPGYI